MHLLRSPARLAVLVFLAAISLFASCSRHLERPNIVLIVVDALRPDYLGCYGNSRPTSPRIDDLAHRGILFETAVAHAPWTKTSFACMLTSLYPFQHGVVDWESVMPDSIVTLPEVLREQGYTTLGIINMLGITGPYKVTRGFDKMSEGGKQEFDAAKTTDIAIELIKGSRVPFFLLVHYEDTHWPYRPLPEHVDLVRSEGDPDPFSATSTPPRRASERPSQENIDREKLLYSACIRRADDAIGRLVDFLDRGGMMKETVVIVTADHGEAFWEHGVRTHGFNLYDEAIRVPLILYCPTRFDKARRIAPQVRHIDIMPTIVELAGARDRGHREGTSLLGLIANGARPASSGSLFPANLGVSELNLKRVPDSRCVRTDTRKIIVEPATAFVELYDLATDPGETVNLWGTAAAARDSLWSVASRIPGANINGWRVGLTGADAASFQVKVSVAGVGHISDALAVAGPGELNLQVDPDSTSLTIDGRPKGLQLVLFDVEPKDAAVSFQAEFEGKTGPLFVNSGKNGRQRIGKAFTTSRSDGVGLPDAFRAARDSARAGVFVWWLPGEPAPRAGSEQPLTAEEKKRLKALGYIQ